MTKTSLTVTVAKDLADLIPVFFKNRHKELESLRAALAGEDFEQLRHLGHRMKGVGNSYGFATVSEIGKRIEDGARNSDRGAIEPCIGEYADYLSRVQVVYE
ncbi:MAG: Hpt domain-containing protein [Betaproteobacteria bacterium]|nr:Hpt domain-containing protein [Betaproteobacteria bacterium]MDH5578408.1 Hpt domain-containing protein [Betaproteobacteria bacterium]